MCKVVSVQKGMWIGNWMYVEQNPKKNWNRVEVEREIERGGEECRASEKVRTLIEKADTSGSTGYKGNLNIFPKW